MLIGIATTAVFMGCEKDENKVVENKKIISKEKIQKTVAPTEWNGPTCIAGIDIYSFAFNEHFVTLSELTPELCNEQQSVLTRSDIYEISKQYSIFEDNIGNTEYLSLSDDLKMEVLEAADEVMCYGTNRIKGWGAFKFRVWFAGLIWSFGLISDTEYIELIEYAVDKLNEKNGRIVVEITWEE